MVVTDSKTLNPNKEKMDEKLGWWNKPVKKEVLYENKQKKT